MPEAAEKKLWDNHIGFFGGGQAQPPDVAERLSTPQPIAPPVHERVLREADNEAIEPR